MVTDDFYFTQNLNFPDEQLLPMKKAMPNYSQQQKDSIQRRLSEFTSAFFETARYLIMNNKKE